MIIFYLTNEKKQIKLKLRKENNNKLDHTKKCTENKIHYNSIDECKCSENKNKNDDNERKHNGNVLLHKNILLLSGIEWLKYFFNDCLLLRKIRQKFRLILFHEKKNV